MKSSYEIFKGDYGISFFRSDTAKMSKVSVKSEAMHRPIVTYAFRNIPAGTFQIPYISWANLNCCGGWSFDKSYLLTAVQDEKKLCSGISFHDEVALKSYMSNLSAEYPYFSHSTRYSGQSALYHIDVTRKGCIGDYLDIDAVQETYAELGITNLNFEEINKYIEIPMIQLLDGTAGFDYANPNSGIQFVTNGLLLGYPIESTAAILTGGID